MTPQQVVEQSKAAYGQWAKQWRDHAKIHSKMAPFKMLTDFQNIGVGKACLLVANGYSFEQDIEVIKKYAHNVDILCCDKTLGHLIRNGIKPKYCIVCDANVSYEKYMKPYLDDLDETILFMNVCANPKWSHHGNWKDIYFFINQDSIRSELEFSKISGCENLIPAGTNVSNAMVIFMTQSSNHGRNNFFGYDKLVLTGFDYCWLPDGKYYAFDEEGGGKKNYMRHIYCVSHSGKHAFSSLNLNQSADWIMSYINGFNLPVVQCSRNSILPLKYRGKLEDHISYRYKPENGPLVKELLEKRDAMLKQVQDLNNKVIELGTDHYFNFLSTV